MRSPQRHLQAASCSREKTRSPVQGTHPVYCEALLRLSDVEVDRGHHAEALRLAREALEGFEKQLGPRDTLLGMSLMAIAKAQVSERPVEATRQAERALNSSRRWTRQSSSRCTGWTS